MVAAASFSSKKPFWTDKKQGLYSERIYRRGLFPPTYALLQKAKLQIDGYMNRGILPKRTIGAWLEKSNSEWSVIYVWPHGPADKAGLEVGAKIRKINGIPAGQLSKRGDLFKAMAKNRKKVRITLAGGETMEIGRVSRATLPRD